MLFFRLLRGGLLTSLIAGGLFFLPQLVDAAACTGSCVPNAGTCPSAFPIASPADTCPTAGNKCCVKDSLSSGPGPASKTCANATGGVCVGKDQQCPTGKTDVDAQFPCAGLLQKCCAGPQAGGGAGVGSPTKLNDPLGGVGLYGVLRRVISGVLGIIGAIALLVFFASGVMYMVGGEGYVTTAKAAMTNAVIGLLVIFFAYSIANWFFLALTTNPM